MVFDQFLNKKNNSAKSLAILLDPDKIKIDSEFLKMMDLINSLSIDYIFYGGSLILDDSYHRVLSEIKRLTKIPVVLFPGSIDQVSEQADAMLFLSLISGRNPELLIGNHVLAAPKIKKMGLETIPTGYILVDCGQATTASYISNTFPIPYEKPGISAATALAGTMLGLKTIYLDGGSGAEKPISSQMINAVSKVIQVPLIVGGGIRTEEQAQAAWNSGADIVVIGTAFEENPESIIDISSIKKSL